MKNTETKIQNTFIDLLKKEPIEKITVLSICDILKIKRQTFYYHYQSIYDLILSIFYINRIEVDENLNFEKNVKLLQGFLINNRVLCTAIIDSFAENILLEYIIDIKSESNDIETINDLYIKKATNLIEKEINYNSLKAINEATIQINSIQENYYLLPSQELDLSNLKNEVNQNISEIFKDISNSISNNNDDINNLLDLYILEFENLINLFSKTSYLYSFAKTGYLIGINEAYLISDESSTKINTKEINLNDILSTNYTNCLITYDKSEVIDNGNRT